MIFRSVKHKLMIDEYGSTNKQENEKYTDWRWPDPYSPFDLPDGKKKKSGKKKAEHGI